MSASGLEAVLLEGISAISDHQLPTGEIGSYAPGPDGRLAYRRSLRASIAVHEALACFDPSSAWEETRSLRGILPPPALRRVCLGTARIRHRIREYLASQELAGHLWREGGKHGERPADPASSAGAALALMDDPARSPRRWTIYARALDRFPVANAQVAEYLALAGEDGEALATCLLREAEAATVELACALARCWARAQLPGRLQLAAALEPGLLERLRSDASDTARIVLALLDLRSTSPEIVPAVRRVVAELPLAAGSGADRCPSLTWALAMAAAARSQTLSEETCPCTQQAS
jgi:hypothetical protein